MLHPTRQKNQIQVVDFNEVYILCHVPTSFIICFWGNQKCDLLDSKGFWRWCINSDYCVLGLCPLSGILKTREHNILKTGSVSVLRWGGETPTLLDPLERPNLNHWSGTSRPRTQNSRCLPPPLRTETDPVSETLCSPVFRILDNGGSPTTQ
jgi:hypothetical protein